jgi:hypothetical protein
MPEVQPGSFEGGRMKKKAVKPPEAGARPLSWTPEEFKALPPEEQTALKEFWDEQFRQAEIVGYSPDGKLETRAERVYRILHDRAFPALPAKPDKPKLSGMSATEAFAKGQQIREERQKS